jgi:hypothetical protein
VTILKLKRISAQLNAVCSDFAATKANSNVAMETSAKEHKKEVGKLQFNMSVFKTRAAKADEAENKYTVSTGVEDFAVLKACIEERDRKISEFESTCFDFEEIRRHRDQG